MPPHGRSPRTPASGPGTPDASPNSLVSQGLEDVGGASWWPGSRAARAERHDAKRSEVALASSDLRRLVRADRTLDLDAPLDLDGVETGTEVVGGVRRVAVEAVLVDSDAYQRALRHVESVGGEILDRVPGQVMLARIPVDGLEQVENHDAIRTLRVLPSPPVPEDRTMRVVGEHVEQTRAAAWQAAGYSGAGVRIGIIDYFDVTAWNAAAAVGDLPSPGGTLCVIAGRVLHPEVATVVG